MRDNQASMCEYIIIPLRYNLIAIGQEWQVGQIMAPFCY